MILISLKRMGDVSHLAVKLDEVKTYLKIDSTIEDKLLLTFIAAAINQCEECTGLSLSKTHWCAVYKIMNDVEEVILPKKPVINMLSVGGYQHDGEKADIDKSLYYRFEDRLVFRHIPFFTKLYVNFEAGYDEDKNLMPAEIKAILLEHIADMYEKRNRQSNFPIMKYKKFRSMKL
jgi:uncharacterized phiE125 gp8 family phage protein